MRATTLTFLAVVSGGNSVASAFTVPSHRHGMLGASPRARVRTNAPKHHGQVSAALTTSLSMNTPWFGSRRVQRGATEGKANRPGKIRALFRTCVRPQFGTALTTIRRAIAIIFAAFVVTFGSVQPSQANAASVSTASVKITSSKPIVQLASTAAAPSKVKLDKMIENYVRKNMFNDDSFDPFESAYREAHYDQTASPYPTIISETAADILGKKEVAAQADREGSAIDKAWAKLNTFADKLQTKFGINKQLSLSTMFIGIFCTPVVALFLGAIAFGDRQKDKSEQAALERYGYGLNDLSAAEQIGEDIEAPDDDEDEEDDEDEDDDDEED